MKAQGNGDKTQCAYNLLKLRRGEVPYDRTRGIDIQIFDRPAGTAQRDLKADALWTLKTYEPRVSADSADIEIINDSGDYRIIANISE